MTFEFCLLIPQYHENCNAMSSFTVLRHVPWNTFICSVVQCFHQFVMVLFIVYYLVLWFLFTVYYLFFSDAGDNEHSQLVDIRVERSIFKCNIQKSVPISLRLKNIVIFKNRNLQLRFEIAMTDIRGQLTTNDKFSELSEKYSQDSYLSQFLELVEEVWHEIMSPIFKKSFFSYSPFLWMGFKCLKAIVSLRGGTLLFTTKLPSILSSPKQKLLTTTFQFSSIDSKF